MILDKIVEYKKEFVNQRKSLIPQNQIISAIDETIIPLDFKSVLKKDRKLKIIAEIKKASPSKGIIRQDFNHLEIARQYQSSGASAVSVLTDEKFFQGSDQILKDVRKELTLPILRKEFIIDEYQIYEARAMRADAILLIAAILDKDQIKDFLKLVIELKMNALVEVHTKEELDKVLDTNAEIIGINNRNLDTFITDIKTTEALIKYIPRDKVIVSESGIKTKEDMKYLDEIGADAVLIGETLMRYENPGDGLKELLSYK